MKEYIKYVRCADCGRKIPIYNAYGINKKPYGYSCYRKRLALIYKQWEDEKNAEYSAKCFAAMQIFEVKKSNSFHDSICKQWNDCKKLTARQLDCIIKGFTDHENISFWIIWQQITNDEVIKQSIPGWIEDTLKYDFSRYIDDEAIINCMFYDQRYKHGFHFYKEYEYSDGSKILIERNGKNGKRLQEHMEDEYIEVVKVIEDIQ